MISKSGLAVELSRLSVFKTADFSSRQYPTDSETASDILWNAYMSGDIKDRTVIDLGAGTGILGIGCMLLGTKHVIFVERDSDAVKILKENLEQYEGGSYSIIESDVKEFNGRGDTVVENPPFDTEKEHQDRFFLLKAFVCAPVIYSLHTASSEGFINALCRDSGFSVTRKFSYKMPIKRSMHFHIKDTKKIELACFRLQRIKKDL